MRKKIVLTLVFFLTFLFLPAGKNIFAQTTSPSASLKVDYELPYPGVLPDNPLYIFKAARDRLINILINDPLKKAEFNILNSNKRMSAGVSLVSKKKDALAISVISKSNNYLFEAVVALSSAKKMGKDIGTVMEKLNLTTLKHKEVLKSLESKVDKRYLKELQKEYKRLESIEEDAKKFGLN